MWVIFAEERTLVGGVEEERGASLGVATHHELVRSTGESPREGSQSFVSVPY